MFSMAIIFPSVPRTFLDVYTIFFTATVVKRAIVESWELALHTPGHLYGISSRDLRICVCGRRHRDRSFHGALAQTLIYDEY